MNPDSEVFSENPEDGGPWEIKAVDEVPIANSHFTNAPRTAVIVRVGRRGGPIELDQ